MHCTFPSFSPTTIASSMPTFFRSSHAICKASQPGPDFEMHEIFSLSWVINKLKILFCFLAMNPLIINEKCSFQCRKWLWICIELMQKSMRRLKQFSNIYKLQLKSFMSKDLLHSRFRGSKFSQFCKVIRLVFTIHMTCISYDEIYPLSTNEIVCFQEVYLMNSEFQKFATYFWILNSASKFW